MNRNISHKEALDAVYNVFNTTQATWSDKLHIIARMICTGNIEQNK